MKLTVLTPLATIVDRDDLVQVSARDAGGAFAIRPSHADFATLLEPTVLSLRDEAGAESYCAVAGGLLQVRHGTATVTTSDGETGSALPPLADKVRQRVADLAKAQADDTATERRLQAALVRHMLESVAADPATSSPGGLPS